MRPSKARAFQNASWLIACRIVQSMVALAVSTLSARYLGPDNYGMINYAGSVVAFALPLAQLGLRNVLVEQLVARPDREGEILGTSLALSLMSGFFCVFGCLSFVFLVNGGQRETVLVCGLYSISLIFQVTEMIQYWYQAKLLSKYTALVSLGVYVLVAGYKILLLAAGKSIYWFALAYALDYGLISGALLVLYGHLGGKRLRFSWRQARALLAKSRYYILSGMMVTVFSQTDKIMLQRMLGNQAVGYYSTALSCVTMSNFVFAAIIDSIRPEIFRSRGQEGFRENVARLYGIVIYLGLAQSLVLTALASPVIHLLYGGQYLAAIPLLQILTWYGAFSHLGTVRNIWMLAEGKQNYLWIINLSGAVLNVAGNFLLIPLMGAAGAAAASVATQVFANFLLCLLLRPLRPAARLMGRGLDIRRILELVHF